LFVAYAPLSQSPNVFPIPRDTNHIYALEDALMDMLVKLAIEVMPDPVDMGFLYSNLLLVLKKGG